MKTTTSRQQLQDHNHDLKKTTTTNQRPRPQDDDGNDSDDDSDNSDDDSDNSDDSNNLDDDGDNLDDDSDDSDDDGDDSDDDNFNRASTAQRRVRRRDTPPPLLTHARERGDSTPTPVSLGAGDASPTLPTHARGGMVPTQSLHAGDASPAMCTSHQTACACKGKGWHIQPLHTGYAGPVFTCPAPHCPAPPMDTGMVRPAQLLLHGVHLPVYVLHPGGGCVGEAGQGGAQPRCREELHVNGGVGALEWRREREKVMVTVGEWGEVKLGRGCAREQQLRQ
ncbi:hypothetical protein EDB89DRAFT_2243964 [Lactarius sanguifluus]|nr:hypothetical protein EDB89DRAFT_2243964 [Lactarius sanguifluus]